jgi:hypothetical protein
VGAPVVGVSKMTDVAESFLIRGHCAGLLEQFVNVQLNDGSGSNVYASHSKHAIAFV